MKPFIRWAAIPIGIIIFLIGLVTFPLPIPIGLPLMIIGLAVAATNPLVMRKIKRWRKNFPETNRKIRKIAPHLPAFIKRFLKRTDAPSN